MLLEGKKLLVTGVLTERSIGYAVAAAAQREGAEVVLTSFDRALRITRRVARRLPAEPAVLELDVTNEAHIAAVAADLDRRFGRLDGLVHAVAFATEDAIGGRFLETPAASAEMAFRVGAFSLKALAAGMEDLLARSPSGGSVVGLDFDAAVSWPLYDWMGVTKAALESVNRYLARYLGPRGIRANLVAAGPLATTAANAIPGFRDLASAWHEQAPLGWNTRDPSPVADACVWLLCDRARATTGEILHVDGGFHSMGAPNEGAIPLHDSVT